VRIGQAGADALERADNGVEQLFLLAELLCPLRLVPQLGVFELAAQLFEAPLLGVEVKDTSAARRLCVAGLRATRRSG